MAGAEPWATFRQAWKGYSKLRVIVGLIFGGFMVAFWAVKGLDWLLRFVIP